MIPPFPKSLALRERMRLSGPKRLLALDGGGVRGLITVEFSRDSRNCRAPLVKQFYYRNAETRFVAKLQRELKNEKGEYFLLGSDALRTLLLVVLRNDTTNSPWPISNNPDAKYNQGEHTGNNLRLPLWQLVRASTAAPTIFRREDIAVDRDLTFSFVDGAVSVYNNLAFLLFVMATLLEYRLGWEMGEDHHRPHRPRSGERRAARGPARDSTYRKPGRRQKQAGDTEGASPQPLNPGRWSNA